MIFSLGLEVEQFCLCVLKRSFQLIFQLEQFLGIRWIVVIELRILQSIQFEPCKLGWKSSSFSIKLTKYQVERWYP
jgi:hypothetical protein